MNRSVTVSAKGALVALVAVLAMVLALAVAYLLGNEGGTAQAAPVPAASGDLRPGTMVTTGTGTSFGVPDELAFTVGVGLVRPTLGQAMRAANGRMADALATLGRLGVRKTDVQTTGLQMNAVYDYHAYGPPTLRGYHVSQQAQVLVRDLTRGGRAVSAVVRTGGNDVRVSGLSLRISDPDARLATSRAAAVKEATAKARQYAAATGQTLGQVVSLREVRASSPSPRPLAFHRGALLDAAAALPIRAGKDSLAVTVRIVWSLR